MKVFKFLSNAFKSIDTFGEPVAVNYRGKTKYQSKIGAFFTVLAYVIISIVMVRKGTQLINRDEPTIK